MIRIPDEVVEAAARAAYAQWVSVNVVSGGVEEDYRTWAQLDDVEREEWCDQSRASIAAAINAWPGVNTDAVRCGTIILHLPKENYIAEG